MEKTKTALQAAKEGKGEIVKAFIEEAQKLAPPLNPIVYDLLSSASANNQISIVKDILFLGISVDGLDHKKQTALYRACRSRCTDSNLIEFLLDQGADVNKIVKGRTPLATACHHNRLDLVTVMIERGAVLHQKNLEEHTPLSIAVYQNHVNLCNLLLQKGAPVDETSQGGFSSLMISACQGHIETTRTLLDYGANLRKRNDLGFTPLMLAAQNGHVQLVKFLISFDVDCVMDCNHRGFTSLEIAADKGHLDVVREFLSNRNISFLSETVVQALMLAVNNNHHSVVKYILAQKENCLHQTNCQGVAALHISAQRGNVELSTLLLEHGANVDAHSSSGYTPLMMASFYGHQLVAKLLIDYGAKLDLEINAESGFTALDIAVKQGQNEVVKVLVEAGASVTRTAKAPTEDLGHYEFFKNIVKEKEGNQQRRKVESLDCTSNTDLNASSFTRNIETQSSALLDLNKLEDWQGTETGAVLSTSKPVPTSSAQSTSVKIQGQKEGVNPAGGCSDFLCDRESIPAPSVYSATAALTKTTISAEEGFREETKVLNIEAMAGVTPVHKKQQECVVTAILPLLPKKEQETPKNSNTAFSLGNHPNATKLNSASPSTPLSIEPFDAAKLNTACASSSSTQSSVARPNTASISNTQPKTATVKQSSVSEDGHANPQNPVVISHSSSVPGTFRELLEVLESGQRQVIIYHDARTITVNDAHTVGMGDMNITHSNKEPEDSEEDSDEG